MPTGGKLIIETSNTELDEDYVLRHHGAAAGPHVMLTITDTGIGMPPEIQAKIFEPFFTTKEKGKGTGLGLATVYGIVKQSQGSIWVYSEPGRGTTFRIYFPRTGEEAAPAKRGKAVRPLAGTRTVLLVEDDEHVRKAALRILEQAGYRVLIASNGGEALRHAENEPGVIDLMLTDVIMPGISGRDLAERMQQLRPELRVLFMSGYTDDAIIHHGVLAEGVALLQKPFTRESLLDKVREVIAAAAG
jgi:CheY-like chemotaxis protein